MRCCEGNVCIESFGVGACRPAGSGHKKELAGYVLAELGIGDRRVLVQSFDPATKNFVIGPLGIP